MRTSKNPLPKAAREALALAVRQKPQRAKRQAALRRAFVAVAFPESNELYPLPADLTAEQRALAVAFADLDDLSFDDYAIPTSKDERRRWLGLAEGGELERVTAGKPMWRRLQEVRDKQRATHKLVDALPMARRLALVGEVLRNEPQTAYGLDDDHFDPRRFFKKLRAEGKTWAPAYANALLSREQRASHELRYLVFFALIRAKVPIAPAWDALLPVGLDDKWMIECARALPEPRRGKAAASALASYISAYTADYGFALLEAFPSVALTEAVFEIGKNARLPHREAVKKLRAIGKRHPIVQQTLDVLLSSTPSGPALRCTSIVTLKDAAKLTPLQRTQIEKAGRRYDGRKLTAEQWLEPQRPGKEPTFASSLELATIVDATGRPLFEVYEYMGDSGTIYKAKTAKDVGAILQGGIEVEDATLGEAIRTALFDRRSKSRGGASR